MQDLKTFAQNNLPGGTTRGWGRVPVEEARSSVRYYYSVRLILIRCGGGRCGGHVRRLAQSRSSCPARVHSRTYVPICHVTRSMQVLRLLGLTAAPVEQDDDGMLVQGTPLRERSVHELKALAKSLHVCFGRGVKAQLMTTVRIACAMRVHVARRPKCMPPATPTTTYVIHASPPPNTHTRTRTHARTHMHTTHTHTYTHIHIHAHPRTRKHIHARTHAHAHTRTHTHTHARTHTPAHAHALTYSRTHALTQTYMHAARTHACTRTASRGLINRALCFPSLSLPLTYLLAR